MKIFPIVIKKTINTGTPVGGNEALLITDSVGSLNVTVRESETNPTPTDSTGLLNATVNESETNLTPTDSSGSLIVTVRESETNPTPTESMTLALSGTAFNEVNPTPTETNLAELTVTQTETNPTPTEAITLQLSGMAFNEVNPTPTETNLSALTVTQTETNLTPTTAETFALTITKVETNPIPTETNLSKLTVTQTEANPTPTETHGSTIRCWASVSSDNDASKTTPANANGQNDGVLCKVKTNNALGDLTNPVVLTSNTFNVPTTGTFASKVIRVWFSVPAGPTADTVTLSYNIGAGAVTMVTLTLISTALHLDGSFTFDVSALTLAQLQSLTLTASYTAAIVASPSTVCNVDAWAVDLLGGL